MDRHACIPTMPVVFSFMQRIILFIFLTCSGSAQERIFQRYTVENGLSQNSVYAIAQDSVGFMWFGTADGVNRFDGYTFTVFRPVPGDPSSVQSTFTRNIQMMKNGDLCIGHDNGLSVYDQHKDGFIKLPIEQTMSGSADIYDICIDPKGRLWFVTPKGIFRLIPSDSAMKSISVMDGSVELKKGQGSYSMFVDRSKRMWLAASAGIFLYDEVSDSFRNFPLVDILDDEFRSVAEDNEGNIWFGTGHGNIFKVSPDLSTVKTYSDAVFGKERQRMNLITQMVFDRSGTLWIGTFEQGLYSFDPTSGQTKQYKHDVSRPGSIAFDIVRALYIDTNDNLWIGTDGGGISVLQLFPKKFHLITSNRGATNSLSDTFVKGVFQDRKGIIWIGTQRGLNRYDPELDSCTLFVPFPKLSNAVSNQIFTITGGENNILWLSTAFGISSFDPSSGKFVHFPGLQPLIKKPVPTVLFHTAKDDSSLWLTAFDIVEFNIRTGKYRHPEFSSDRLKDKAFLLPYWDSSGTFWAGSTLYGMFRYRPANGTLDVFMTAPDDSNSISSNGMKSIFEERKGKFWIGTTNGLNMFDEEQRTFTRYFEKDGLPNAFIYGILPDDRGRLWLSTNKGLSRFDPAEKRFRNFTVKDGLQSTEFNTGAYFRNRSTGYLFFGGINGVTYFHPDSIIDSQFSPPVVLTELKKFDRTIDAEQPFSRMKEIMLPHDENTVTFSFAAMDYSGPDRVQYFYRLEGFESDWISAGTRRDVRYTNLSPGEYLFRVRATNADGVIGKHELMFRLVIVPPFWATVWFRSLSVLLFIGFLIGSVRFAAFRKYRQQIEELEHQKRIMEERQKTRDKIARDLHDDLASTVGSAGLFIETVKRTLGEDVQQARDYLDKTSSILNEAEEAMSDIVWSVSPKHDTLQSLATRIRLVTTELCRANGIGYAVEVKGNTDLPLSDEVRRGLYLIFKEVLNNCLKHSRAKSVEVSIGLESDRLILQVKDDGIGITETGPADRLGGNGMNNIRKRAEEIGAQLSLTSAAGAGTTVRVERQLTQLGH